MLAWGRLRQALNYDPHTGVFTWRRREDRSKEWNSRYSGTAAGFENGDGAIRIMIDRKKHLAHRLAWFWMKGAWPIGDVDHRDLDRRNNRWANLREATRSQNSGNKRAYSTNTSGLKGASYMPKFRKWQASITVGRKQRSLGKFDCPAAAHLAYVIAADDAFGEFARAA